MEKHLCLDCDAALTCAVAQEIEHSGGHTVVISRCGGYTLAKACSNCGHRTDDGCWFGNNYIECHGECAVTTPLDTVRVLMEIGMDVVKDDSVDDDPVADIALRYMRRALEVLHVQA